MSEVEYPRWVYPPDGGPGCIVQTPDERPKGWLDAPSVGGPQMGERIIGQPVFTVPPSPATFTTQGATPPLPPDFPAPPDDEGEARKSKKK